MKHLNGPKRRRSHTRIAAVMAHTIKYAFKGRSRLAADAGISRSALSRLMSGRTRPTYRLLTRIMRPLEKELGRPLDCRELVSENGQYPTTFVCELLGCPGCLPHQTNSSDPRVRAVYERLLPGTWSGDNQEAAVDDWQPIEEAK